MSFNVSLSGLNAAQKDLSTTSNNIANVNTIGFKESRAEFSDVYSNSLFSNASTNVGSGVATASIAQQFHQGSMSFTDNALDLAINGSGFFVTSSELGSQDYSYTRAGAFKLNDDNFMVDSQGNYLMALPVNADGTAQSVSLSTSAPVQLPQVAGQPEATTEVSLSMNLPAAADELDPALFDPEDPSTYNSSTSVTIYDSLGESHIQTTYFIKPTGAALNNNNQWVGFTTVDNEPVDMYDHSGTPPGPVSGSYGEDTDGDGVADQTNSAVATASGQTGFVITFDDLGSFTGTSPANLQTEALGQTGAGVIDAGADGTQTLNLNFDDPTQYASVFEVTSLSQDGSTVGRLTNVEVSDDGLINATYSNGTTQALGKVALARFSNEQGLTQVGNTSWQASQASGEALVGEPSVGSFGSIQSAALEQSNVDLTSELVDLIAAQRNFEANSRALDVSNQLSDNILQIR
ncbi:flagellar hook protein FlgE [Ferrimonas lipolytica]|uniref:Flagellar hook protein FlgE n=1 Tax=Ferrimonas lipolytica TaxID=2724191 RepID=A0A6H1UF40_9GAMM|nr:flagellar hook protein FlgE [Ferrimonas lipolytica]QIZ77249.1 flagellar hook protein FlgE [Ferrimonas lipolytica]